jgi:hypothetical protein
MTKQFDSAAYHEVGHVTAAVVQAMPLRQSGLYIDLFGHGVAKYFERPLSDLGMTDLDHRERKFTMIALYAAHMAQLRFCPEADRNGWADDMGKIRTFSRQMYQNDESAQIALQEEMQQRAKRLVDRYWPIIDELAEILLAKPCTQMSQEDINLKWGCGSLVRHMSGNEIVEFFNKHAIRAKVVDDNVSGYDSTQDKPIYDSLA